MHCVHLMNEHSKFENTKTVRFKGVSCDGCEKSDLQTKLKTRNSLAVLYCSERLTEWMGKHSTSTHCTSALP